MAKKIGKKKVSKKAPGKKSSRAVLNGKDLEKSWPLWEVFIQTGRGRGHEHAGSLHAPDEEMALLNARDLYARRDKVTSIWVVESKNITASHTDDREILFDISFTSPYRHPQFYPDSF